MPGSPLPDGTYSISQFAWEVKGLLADAWPSVWVAGEVQRLHSAATGHLYFELVEKGRGDKIEGRLDCVLWSSPRRLAEAAFRRAGVELTEGVVLRCRGNPDFWPGGGRLRFAINDVDPVFLLGDLERRRRETLKALKREELLERNRGLDLPLMPLDVALVTSAGSAAEADFMDTLVQSGVGFRVFNVHSTVQGAMAEVEIERAFRLLRTFLRRGGSLDAVALVRGGGSRSDLAAFDSRRVARAVALSPLPVVCGVGHQIDQSIVDLVAHSSCKTPTEAAEYLVTRVETTTRRIHDAGARLASTGSSLLRDCAAGYEAVQRGLVRAAERAGRAAKRAVDELGLKLRTRAPIIVAGASTRLAATAGRLPGPARRALKARVADCRRQEARVSPAAERLLARVAERVEAHGRLCEHLSPERTLERGFSLTRTEGGQLVRSIDDVAAGVRLRTSVQGGTIGSTVHDVANERAPGAPREEEDRA